MEIKNYKTVLLSTAYFGPVEYFYYLYKFKKAVIEQHESWPKQTFRNRAVIVTDKGMIPLTVPVNKVNGNHTQTKDILISYQEKWFIKHWRAIETAYQNSPYFLYYADEIKEILFSGINNLISLNKTLTSHLCSVTGIDCNIEFSNRFNKTTETDIFDLRYKLTPKLPPLITHFPPYIQVFSEKQPFIPNASILDLIFCLGPESESYLKSL